MELYEQVTRAVGGLVETWFPKKKKEKGPLSALPYGLVGDTNI